MDITTKLNIAMLLVNVVSMIAAIWSCIFAVKARSGATKAQDNANIAKAETEKMLNEIKVIMIDAKNQTNNTVKNKGDIDIKNEGKNEGIIGGIITGGVNRGERK